MSAVDLSVCMIVKNEEKMIGRCLDSITPLAAEIIIVDTGSNDSTVDIVGEYGAVIGQFDFSRVDFAGARNHSLSLATKGWILVMDADEALDADSIPVVKQLILASQNEGYVINRRNRGQVDPGVYNLDYAVRLFPNKPGHRYTGRVHETVDQALLAAGATIKRSEIYFDHFLVDLTDEQLEAKSRRYIKILLEEIEDNPEDQTRHDFLAAEYFKLQMFDEAMETTKKLVRMRPDDPMTHGNLGIYYLLLKGDMVRARTELKRSLKLDPLCAESMFYLGIVDIQEGNVERGVRDIKVAARLEPRLQKEVDQILKDIGRK